MPQTDITFKELFGRDVQPLLGLLLPDWTGPLHVVELNPELPATLRRVDLLVRGVCRVTRRGPMIDRLIALDWQVQPDPELPATMFLRAALAYYKHRVRVTTLLVAATRAAACTPRLVWAEHARGELEHDVILVKLYEQDAERALAREQPELWVLAAAMVPRDGDRAGLLVRVQDRLAKAAGLAAEKRQRLLDFASTFATLEMNQEAAAAFVAAALRRRPRMLDLRQSGYAQMLIAEGRAEGKAQGNAEAIVALLDARRVRLGAGTRSKILGCRDLELLRKWLMLAVDGHDAELRAQVGSLKKKAAPRRGATAVAG